MSQDTRIAYCPHCGNTTPQKLVHTQAYVERVWSVSDTTDPHDVDALYFVAVCQVCHEVLVYGGFPAGYDGEFPTASLEWPEIGLDHSVPERIRDIYEEASRIKNIAPNAFAVQIRRALEAICQDRGVIKGNLVQGIQELSNRGDIPKTLAEASDLLRLVGNLGAHAGDRDVHPLEGKSLDRFFKAIVEYLYVSPKRIQEFRKSLERFRQEVKSQNEGQA